MEQIQSINGLITWNVLSCEKRLTANGTHKTYFKVACSACGYEKRGRKHDIQKTSSCVGCSKRSPKAQPTEKPSAVKLDETGSCVFICDIGMVEFIRDYQTKHEASEREAVSAFVESAKASLPEDDPYKDTLTLEAVRAKVRRATGKKDNTNKLGEVPQGNRSYKIEPTIESVAAFVEKYLPDYTLVRTTKSFNT